MIEKKLNLKVLNQFDLDEVLILVSTNNFIPYSFDPKVSSLASVIQYQYNTSNYNFNKLIAIYDDKLLVGILFLPVFEMIYNQKKIFCVQGASGYILPQYRGIFGLVIDKLLESYPNTIKLFMFSALAVQKTILKKGFHEICNGYFLKNNYIILRPFSFLKSTFKNVFIKKVFVFFVFFDFLISKLYVKNKIMSYENIDFSEDYSLIEKDYYIENKEFIVPVWNVDVLKFKYLKTTEKFKKNCDNNSTFHFVFKNSQKKIIGSLVARKIANYNRIVIVELHTISENRKKIVNDLINILINKMVSYGYDSIMFNGIGTEYESILRDRFITIQKKVNFKAFICGDFKTYGDDFISKIRLYYSTDDTNF